MKKVVISLVAVGVVVAGVATMSAFEAHVINVTAKIENALSVLPTEIDFGTVFPQEYLTDEFTVELSTSFLEEERADDVHYVIRQKPKPIWEEPLECGQEFADIEEARAYCHDHPEDLNCCYLSLCPYLSKLDGDPDDNNDTGVPSYYVEDGNGDYCEAPNPDYATGFLSKLAADISDLWIVDLKVPPVAGFVGQDWPVDCPTVAENEQEYGCDLWIEVTEVSRISTETLGLENKDDSWNIIVDNTYGTMTYTTSYQTFMGSVAAYNLEPNAKYQITLNGPGVCTATDNLLAGAGSNLFQSGYWDGVGPNLSGSCTGAGEGIYNMNLINDHYTVMTDGSGNFNYPFNLSLPQGTYTGVKVLVKKMLDDHVSPWVDSSTVHTTNLFETAPISFTILP